MHSYLLQVLDPLTYAEATWNPIWEAAIDEKYNFLFASQIWEIVSLPSNHKLVTCKWIYSTNKSENAQVSRYKARLVAKGFQQVQGIDYDETFAPVEKMDSI